MRGTGKLSDIHLSDGLTMQHRASLGWLPRSFASEASGSPVAEVQAKPIKKGLSAGTVPPATDQVPPAAAQHPGPSVHDSHSSTSTADLSGSTRDVRKSSATVGVDRPSAAAVPAGVDQVPPSSTAPLASTQHDNSEENDSQTPASDQSMQSVIDDIGDIGQLNKGSSKIPEASVGRWQRFKWWVWGTPQQYWTYEDSNRTRSTKADAPDAAASTTDSVGGSSKWRRSKWSIADIIGSAILRSGITKR